jgi:hypothetical protein
VFVTSKDVKVTLYLARVDSMDESTQRRTIESNRDRKKEVRGAERRRERQAERSVYSLAR